MSQFPSESQALLAAPPQQYEGSAIPIPVWEDAVSYLRDVKRELSRRPVLLQNFWIILAQYSSDTLGIAEVIRCVYQLFHGHRRLLHGFSMFLPPGYQIEFGEVGADSRFLSTRNAVATPHLEVSQPEHTTVSRQQQPAMPPYMEQEYSSYLGNQASVSRGIPHNGPYRLPEQEVISRYTHNAPHANVCAIPGYIGQGTAIHQARREPETRYIPHEVPCTLPEPHQISRFNHNAPHANVQEIPGYTGQNTGISQARREPETPYIPHEVPYTLLEPHQISRYTHDAPVREILGYTGQSTGISHARREPATRAIPHEVPYTLPELHQISRYTHDAPHATVQELAGYTGQSTGMSHARREPATRAIPREVPYTLPEPHQISRFNDNVQHATVQEVPGYAGQSIGVSHSRREQETRSMPPQVPYTLPELHQISRYTHNAQHANVQEVPGYAGQGIEIAQPRLEPATRYLPHEVPCTLPEPHQISHYTHNAQNVTTRAIQDDIRHGAETYHAERGQMLRPVLYHGPYLLHEPAVTSHNVQHQTDVALAAMAGNTEQQTAVPRTEQARMSHTIAPALPNIVPEPVSVPRKNQHDQRAAVDSRPTSVEASLVEQEAIKYWNKIQSQYSENEEVLERFVDIMGAYYTGQRTAKKVTEEVTVLFHDEPDLLREFHQFLPAAVSVENESG